MFRTISSQQGDIATHHFRLLQGGFYSFFQPADDLVISMLSLAYSVRFGSIEDFDVPDQRNINLKHPSIML
jgi:hypothetical protein